jgi:hypothetical protein
MARRMHRTAANKNDTIRDEKKQEPFSTYPAFYLARQEGRKFTI